MSDQYANWRERLANSMLPKSQQKKILTYESVVDPGFYRKRLTEKTPGGATKTIGYEPVAFWIDGEGETRELVGMIAGRALNAGQCEAEWTYVCDKPIPEEVYRAVAERGEPWPDQHVRVINTADKADKLMAFATQADKAAMREEAAKPGEVTFVAGALDNPPAEPDPSAEIIAEIEALKPGVADYAAIESDEQSARAQDLRSQLTAAAGRLDKHRESLVRPHLDAQQKINGQFNPIIRATKELAGTVLNAMAAWERQKREQARLAQQAAEKAAREAEEAGKPAAPAPPSNAPPPSEQIKGATGRAAHVSTKWLAVVDDQDAAYQAMKANPVIIEAIRKVAQARLDAGIDTPGVSKKEDVKIR